MNINFKSLVKKKSPWDYITYTALITLGIGLDQLTKWLAAEFLKPTGTVPIIKDVIHLTYVENPGAAFGMLKDAPWVFNTLSVIAITAIILYLFLGHASDKLYAVSLAMIASGGIGNMIDRVSLKYVVDFIDFRLINFAVFNGADSFVCVGAGLLILAMILDIIKESREARAKSNTEDGK